MDGGGGRGGFAGHALGTRLGELRSDTHGLVAGMTLYATQAIWKQHKAPCGYITSKTGAAFTLGLV